MTEDFSHRVKSQVSATHDKVSLVFPESSVDMLSMAKITTHQALSPIIKIIEECTIDKLFWKLRLYARPNDHIHIDFED